MCVPYLGDFELGGGNGGGAMQARGGGGGAGFGNRGRQLLARARTNPPNGNDQFAVPAETDEMRAGRQRLQQERRDLYKQTGSLVAILGRYKPPKSLSDNPQAMSRINASREQALDRRNNGAQIGSGNQHGIGGNVGPLVLDQRYDTAPRQRDEREAERESRACEMYDPIPKNGRGAGRGREVLGGGRAGADVPHLTWEMWNNLKEPEIQGGRGV